MNITDSEKSELQNMLAESMTRAHLDGMRDGFRLALTTLKVPADAGLSAAEAHKILAELHQQKFGVGGDQ